MTLQEQFSFDYSSTKGRRIRGSFDGGQISSDAGLMLLREADRSSGLTKAVGGKIKDQRQGGKILHKAETMIRQRIYGMCSSNEDLNDFDHLREDPLWQSACEVDTPFAGKSTLSRFESCRDRSLAVSMHEVFLDQFIGAHKSAPEEIVLDFDATDDPVHGNQEGRFFHGYYDHYCFLPLYVFCGEHLLVAYLRPGNVGAAKHTGAILKLLVQRIRESWPQVRIIFRADSGFCRDFVLSWCERHGVEYVVGLAGNPVLLHESESFIDKASQEYERTGEKQRVFGGVIYGAKSWRRKRHVIVKAEHTDQGSNPRFVVSSLEHDDQYVYEDIYCARGESENRIKEQLMLFADRTSSSRWWANQWRLLLSGLAYILMHSVRRIGFEGTQFAKAQCHTIRLKFIKIGALIERTKSRVKIRMPSGYPNKEVFINALQRLRPT